MFKDIDHTALLVLLTTLGSLIGGGITFTIGAVERYRTKAAKERLEEAEALIIFREKEMASLEAKQQREEDREERRLQREEERQERLLTAHNLAEANARVQRDATKEVMGELKMNTALTVKANDIGVKILKIHERLDKVEERVKLVEGDVNH